MHCVFQRDIRSDQIMLIALRFTPFPLQSFLTVYNPQFVTASSCLYYAYYVALIAQVLELVAITASLGEGFISESLPVYHQQIPTDETEKDATIKKEVEDLHVEAEGSLVDELADMRAWIVHCLRTSTRKIRWSRRSRRGLIQLV